jgi:two-component system response regulator YesN
MYKLLIVDDEEHILEGMKNTLDWSALGIVRVETAQTYHRAVDLAVSMEPDIAIFDVCLQDYYGYDIINKLNELGLRTKYIMMSGYDQFEYARQAINCGAKSYLLKPVDRQELKSLIERIIVEDLGGTIADGDMDAQNRDPVLGVDYASLSKLINKILIIVKAEYGTNLKLKVVADMFRMNSAYLGQIFLRETHMKFSDYLREYRLLKAREMIQSTDEKIAYIAHKVGYGSINYFYTQFHEYFHFSPTDLRSDTAEEEFL